MLDAHCHATRTLPEPAPPPATERARIVCGVAPGGWPVIADWARAWPGTIPAFGVHPWEAGLADDGWEEELERLLRRFPEAWVGEIGLDAARADRAPPERQLDALARQLRLAARLRRRVNLHCVRAQDAVLDALDREYLPCWEKGFILHSFGGPQQAAAAFAARGAYFSLGPLAARRDSRKMRALARFLPPERLLLESDAFLEPGVDAEEELLCTLRWLSAATETPLETLRQTLDNNARRLLE